MVMFCAVPGEHAADERRLVMVLGIEADRIGVKRPPQQLRGLRHDQGGVDAAAEKASERDVAATGDAAIDKGAEIIVAAGGDGTAMAVAGAMLLVSIRIVPRWIAPKTPSGPSSTRSTSGESGSIVKTRVVRRATSAGDDARRAPEATRSSTGAGLRLWTTSG